VIERLFGQAKSGEGPTMTQSEKEKLIALEKQIKKLSAQVDELKNSNYQTKFEILETDRCLVQTYN
jgi:superfamily II RNA helicase